MKYTHIKEFIFNKANYDLSDGNGSKILLEIDYKNNSFKVKTKDSGNQELIKEVESTAKDLLKRKHAVNFAEQ